MPDEHGIEAIENARRVLEAQPTPDPMGYAHFPMTPEEAAKAHDTIAADGEKHRKEAELEKRLKQPLEPYPIPLGAMLAAQYQRYGMDRRHRCTGKHVAARVARAKAKRAKKHKTPFNP